MKILESYKDIAKSMLTEHAWDRKFGESLPTLEDVMKEADDDAYVHVGGGRYKEKNRATGEPLPNSPSYIKKDSGGYEMVDDDDPRLSKGADKDDKEEPKGKGLGKGDFERDFDGGEPKKDVKGREYDPMTGKGKGLDYRGEPDDEEYFKSMMGGGEPDDKPFGGDTGRDADSGAVDGPSPEDGDWDSEQVMTAKLDGEEVGDIIDQGEDHPNYDKAMDYVLQFDPDDEKVISGPGRKKEESIIINGKKYRAIKESVESKKHLLREMYERIGGK